MCILIIMYCKKCGKQYSKESNSKYPYCHKICSCGRCITCCESKLQHGKCMIKIKKRTNDINLNKWAHNRSEV